MHLRGTKPVREPNWHSKETDASKEKTSQLSITSKALHISQNAFPNARCQSSLKICNSDIGCQDQKIPNSMIVSNIVEEGS